MSVANKQIESTIAAKKDLNILEKANVERLNLVYYHPDVSLKVMNLVHTFVYYGVYYGLTVPALDLLKTIFHA